MSFWGHSFTFNGIPCEDYDLMLYNIGNNTHSAGKFASGMTIVEDKPASAWKPIFYGAKWDKKLEFDIVFGVNPARADAHKYLDRYELEAIAMWLTGHSQYMWLEIEQEDMEYVRYRCIISELEMIEYGNMPWALKAHVTCDSPYAYLYPQTYRFTVSGSQNVTLYNESGHNGYYSPTLLISFNDASGSVSINNQTDNGRTFTLTNVPRSEGTIRVDNDTKVITSESGSNIYNYFNFQFLRLLRGVNELTITGNCTVDIICEFPVNMGG